MSSLRSRLEDMLKSRSVTGIECVLPSDGAREFNFVVLKKIKNRLDTDSSGSKIKDIESLKQKLPSSHPVFLAINGRGIIHKKLALSEGESDASLLNKVLPAANPVDFYIQKVTGDEGSQIVSAIRKSAADTVLNEMKKNGFHIIGCSLGPFSFQSMIPLLDNSATSREVVVSGYKLLLGANEVSGFEPVEVILPSSLKLIGGEVVQPELVTPFASAVGYFISDGRQTNADIPMVASESMEFRQKQIFKVTAGTIVTVFLAALIVNFFLFSSYSQKHNDYSTKVAANQNMIQHHEKLRAEVEQKQVFLERTGLLEASRTSLYGDRIAKELPDAIQLTQLNIFPLEKKSNAGEDEIAFIPKNILVSGTCKKSIELNQWMDVLKKIEWISDVSIINFSQDKSDKTGKFSIEIKMK